ncbi:MAG: 4'-phosphopantetheinyl transferase superfamily [Linnemannia gamsii]|nr:MAG: 4'-phosphopantetheinyl transferase superfamily [Linnemannia gamsii]
MPITRWAFNIRQPLLLENVEPLVTSLTDDDKPNIVPVSNLLNFLPKIECDRLLQFRLEDDMRRALIGRLMIHAFFAAYHGCRWDKLVFSRSEANKPILLQPEHLTRVSFNISHHGDWVILVGDTSLESTFRLGVDVMDFQEQVPGESFDTFSACFLDQFTADEVAFMKNAPADPSSPTGTGPQLKRFYRMWCLKESIVKALGVGIDFNLKSFEFDVQDDEETTKPTLSTRIQVHEPSPEFPEEGWSFEEALLDADHCYAIAAQSEMEGSGHIMDGSEISRLNWKELLKDAIPYPAQFS